MNTPQPITKEHFEKRLVNLCLRSGLTGFPKDSVDQHILLKSAVLTLGHSDTFTEREINDKLKHWIQHISQIQGIDHGTLRRWLVDTGYLTRSKDGSSYQISPSGPRALSFEEAIEQNDVASMIDAAREEMAQRKKAYVEKQKASGESKKSGQ